MKKISATRLTYLTIGFVVLLANLLAINGVFLFDETGISWLHWLPTIMLPFAALTGICPLKNIFEKIGFSKDSCER